MKVIIKARHMHLTAALRAHAEEKLGSALSKIFDRPAAKIEIELSELGHVHGGTKECRATLWFPGGNTITICEAGDDLYSAINLAHDRMANQIKRQLGRRRQTKKARQSARRRRTSAALENLTVSPERWEREVQEYERSLEHTGS